MHIFIRRKLAQITLGWVGLCAATAVWAVPVDFGTWYEFAFFGAGQTARAGTGTVPIPGTAQVEGPEWTFSGPAIIALTDNFSEGDSFSLFDNGVLVGSTPAVAKGRAGQNGVHPEQALRDPAFSHGIFSLGPGEHSLTIRVDNSPFWGGAAFFQVTSAVPDGGSHLLLVGLGALALFRRFLNVRFA